MPRIRFPTSVIHISESEEASKPYAVLRLSTERSRPASNDGAPPLVLPGERGDSSRSQCHWRKAGRRVVPRMLGSAARWALSTVHKRQQAVGACSSAYLLPTGDGPVVGTDAGFTQQLQAFSCSVLYPDKGFAARVRVPYSDYAGSHVQACTLHVQLWDSANGYVGDETADCTAKARTGAPYEVWVPGWHHSSSGYSRSWWVKGFVNIRTVVA